MAGDEVGLPDYRCCLWLRSMSDIYDSDSKKTNFNIYCTCLPWNKVNAIEDIE